jgi:ATP-dependent exoDNAse (exonuclease V), alpha subunit - helicase superfamily I member
MGDTAQLPPVMQKESPALNADYLKKYGLTVHQTELKQIVRQDEGSGILYNATLLREALATGVVDKYPKLHLSSFSDLRKVSGEDLIDEISSAYSRDGMGETMIITRSNKRAVIFNNGIRNRILYREEELSAGDLLMVAHNNYFWKANENNEKDFIANGEIMQVLRVHRTEEQYGFRFVDALIRFQEDEREAEVKLLADTLQTDTPSLTKEMSDNLFNSVWEDYADVTNKRERIKKLKSDAYFNVLQVKYAYAVTCHKAQGGQWTNVFLDIGYMTEEMLGEDFYRWLYTAFTRATEHLYLVNLPHEFEE